MEQYTLVPAASKGRKSVGDLSTQGIPLENATEENLETLIEITREDALNWYF
jgi:hypothetical protein